MDILGEHLCTRCHGPAEFGFGTTWLCENCYGIIGSCCMEFDGDDLFMEEGSWEQTRLATKR